MKSNLWAVTESADWIATTSDKQYTAFGGSTHEGIIDWELRVYWLARAGQTVEYGCVPDHWGSRRLHLLVEDNIRERADAHQQ